MSIDVRFIPTSLTAEKYDETMRVIKESGPFPPDGLVYHVCFGSAGNLRVSADLGLAGAVRGLRCAPTCRSWPRPGSSLSGPPEISEVHRVLKR